MSNTKFESRSALPQGVILAVAVFSFVAIVALQIPRLQKLQRPQTSSLDQLKQELEEEKLRLGALKTAPGFGFNNLISDWTFLNFLQYFGDEPTRLKTDYRLSPDFFEVILNRDPRFLNAYTFLSTSTTLYAAQPDRSIALMNRGLESLTPQSPPGSYNVWRIKAIDELLFLGDAQTARRSFNTAADWAILSGQPGGETAAQLSRQTAQFIAANPNSKSAQVAAWAMVLTAAVDDRSRQQAVRQIQLLGGTVDQTAEGEFRVQLPPQD